MEKGALMRGIEFKVTIDEYLLLHGKPCHYCGISSIGLDRIDSAICYRLDNVVPCCTVCNMMKGTLERDAFITHCKRITNNHTNFSTEDNHYLGYKHLKKEERKLIIDILNENAGNRVKTANTLGISTTTLWRKIKSHNILKTYNKTPYDLS